MKINDLPLELQTLVAERILEQPHYYSRSDLIYLHDAFNWSASIEGLHFWNSIDAGNSMKHSDFYPHPVILNEDLTGRYLKANVDGPVCISLWKTGMYEKIIKHVGDHYDITDGYQVGKYLIDNGSIELMSVGFIPPEPSLVGRYLEVTEKFKTNNSSVKGFDYFLIIEDDSAHDRCYVTKEWGSLSKSRIENREVVLMPLGFKPYQAYKIVPDKILVEVPTVKKTLSNLTVVEGPTFSSKKVIPSSPPINDSKVNQALILGII